MTSHAPKCAPIPPARVAEIRRRMIAAGCSATEVRSLVSNVAHANRERSQANALRAVTDAILRAESKPRPLSMDATIDPSLVPKIELREAARTGHLDEHTRALYDAQPDQPDDSRYRPCHLDSTLRGAGRATGATAAAVKRGHTVTNWQHAAQEQAS